jgi:hypothetical protein
MLRMTLEERDRIAQNAPSGSYVETVLAIINPDLSIGDALRPGCWIFIDNAYIADLYRVNDDMTLTRVEITYGAAEVG